MVTGSCRVESSDSTQLENTVAIIGGVVAIIFIFSLMTAMTIMIIIKVRRQENTTKEQKRYMI